MAARASSGKIASLVFGVALTLAPAAPVLAKPACAIAEAAGLPAPPPMSKVQQGQFRIFWHIATQIEEIADAERDPAALADIRKTQKLVDGYFINALLNDTTNAYWPGRPTECTLNYGQGEIESQIEVDGEMLDISANGAEERSQCKTMRTELLKKLGYGEEQSGELQIEALKRVSRNLDLPGEQKRGKDIIGALIVQSAQMRYDRASDTIKLTRLPPNDCALSRLGLSVSGVMAYQVPNKQYFAVPYEGPDGKLVDSQDFRQTKIPGNTRVYRLLKDAYDRAQVPFGDFFVLLRRWDPKRIQPLAKTLAANPLVVGFNFEGGSRDIALKPRKLPNYATGIAWLLKNTTQNISILMPAYWEKDGVGNTAEIDTLPARTRSYVETLNTQVSQKLGLSKGKNAFCDSRIILIPASYGRPVRPATLPSMRNGTYAGTVLGQIRMLSDWRSKNCG